MKHWPLPAGPRTRRAGSGWPRCRSPLALIFQATAHAIRGEQEAMEARIAEAISLAPDDPDVLGCPWGHCRATFSMLAGHVAEACAVMVAG